MILGRGGDDEIDGDDGSDRLFGGKGDDDIDGDDGDDRLFGGAGNDDLDGDDGQDRLAGGRGDDTLDGGAGNDILRGGAGADTFVVDDDEGGRDRIADFAHGVDVIDLDDVDGIDSFADVMATAVQRGSNVVFRLDDDLTVVVQNTTLDAFSADDFVF